MRQSNRRRRPDQHGSLISFCLRLWVVMLILTSAAASSAASSAEARQEARAAANEVNHFSWHPPACRADRARIAANDAMPGEAVFVNQAQARTVLTTIGTGRLEIHSLQGKPLAVHVFRPSRFNARTGRIWFVMHGTGRDATRYLQHAAPLAERYQVLALALEFSRKDYPSGDAYTLGVVSDGRADARAAAEGRWRSPLKMPYAEIEQTFSAVRAVLHSHQPGYFIFGHSAGAQFVHRLLTFAHCPRVLGAVAANAGWYTLPTTDERLPPFPYSLRGTPREFHDPRSLLAAPLTLLLGTRDTQSSESDPHLRASAGAMAQGANRLERGRFYHQHGIEAARHANVRLGWTLQLAEGAGHEVAEVIAPAAQRLFAPVPEMTHGPQHGLQRLPKHHPQQDLKYRPTTSAALSSATDGVQTVRDSHPLKPHYRQ